MIISTDNLCHSPLNNDRFFYKLCCIERKQITHISTSARAHPTPAYPAMVRAAPHQEQPKQQRGILFQVRGRKFY